MRKLLIPVMLCLILIPLINAVPPITSEFVGNTGFAIEADVQNYYKINEGAQVHIWVFNRTNGKILDSTVVSCAVELTNYNGTVMLSGNPSPSNNHFYMSRPPNIVTEIGIYGLTIVCNDSSTGGYKTHFFTANNTGRKISDSRIILFIIFTIVTFAFLIISLYKTLDAFVNVNIDMKIIVLGLGSYFLNFFYYFFLINFLQEPLLLSFSLMGIKAFGITHVLLPLIGLIFSWIKNKEVS